MPRRSEVIPYLLITGLFFQVQHLQSYQYEVVKKEIKSLGLYYVSDVRVVANPAYYWLYVACYFVMLVLLAYSAVGWIVSRVKRRSEGVKPI